MKIGIDSYCYHRFFGEVYPHQKKPPKQMTLEDFIKRAHELKVDGVSLESCFIPKFDASYLSEIKGMLDGGGTATVAPPEAPKRKRRMSRAGKMAIAAAQKRRWKEKRQKAAEEEKRQAEVRAKRIETLAKARKALAAARKKARKN